MPISLQSFFVTFPPRFAIAVQVFVLLALSACSGGATGETQGTTSGTSTSSTSSASGGRSSSSSSGTTGGSSTSGAFRAVTVQAMVVAGTASTIDLAADNTPPAGTELTLVAIGHARYGFAQIVTGKLSYTGAVGGQVDSYTLSDGAAQASGIVELTIDPGQVVADLPPTIVSTTPANLATGVSSTAPISIIFSEAMNLGSVSVAVTNDQGPVTLASPHWSSDATTVTFAAPLTGLLGSFVYRVSVNGQDPAGSSLIGTTAFSFQIGTGPTLPLTAYTTLPHMNVPYVAPVDFSLVFNDAVNQSMLSAVSIGGATLDCQLDANPDQIDCSITASLDPSTDYELDLDPSAQSVDGWTFANDFRYAFITADVPDAGPGPCTPPLLTAEDPADNAEVGPNYGSLQIWFSEPMDEASVEGALQVYTHAGQASPSPLTFSWWPNGQSVGVTFANTAGYNSAITWSVDGTIYATNGCFQVSSGQIHTIYSQHQVTLPLLASLTGQVDPVTCAVEQGPYQGLSGECEAGSVEDVNQNYFWAYGAISFDLTGVTGTSVVSAYLTIPDMSWFDFPNDGIGLPGDTLVLYNANFENGSCLPLTIVPYAARNGDPGIVLANGVQSLSPTQIVDVTTALTYDLQHPIFHGASPVTEWALGVDSTEAGFNEGSDAYFACVTSSTDKQLPTLMITY